MNFIISKIIIKISRKIDILFNLQQLQRLHDGTARTGVSMVTQRAPLLTWNQNRTGSCFPFTVIWRQFRRRRCSNMTSMLESMWDMPSEAVSNNCNVEFLGWNFSYLKWKFIFWTLSYISVKNENIDQVYFSKGTCNAIPIYFHHNHQLSLLHNCFHQSCGFYNDWNLIMSINVPCSDYAIMKCNCFACIGTVHII